MRDRETERRTVLQDLQVDDIAQDHEMLSGLLSVEQRLIAIGNLAHDMDSVRELVADALRIVREALKPTEVEDLRRHKLRGDLSDFAAREARKIRRLPDVQIAVVPKDRAPGPGGMRSDTADSDRSTPEPDRAAGRETPQEVARG